MTSHSASRCERSWRRSDPTRRLQEGRRVGEVSGGAVARGQVRTAYTTATTMSTASTASVIRRRKTGVIGRPPAPAR
ncbi:hypothetical protein [Knoellia aerolata]|uniref:hypothetical protein n=1 Tax=Knoellia aerolata TaxID=442954 RepID=UPI000B2C51B4|nr:hypothetical protein [Knoellia aerolata]